MVDKINILFQGRKGPEGRESRKAQRLAKKKNEVERGAWRQTPECKKISSETAESETESISPAPSKQQQRKKEKEGVDFGPWFINETEHLRVKYTSQRHLRVNNRPRVIATNTGHTHAHTLQIKKSAQHIIIQPVSLFF